MKSYELDVMNWGGDRYMLAAWGHHDIEEFKNKCREEYSSFMYALDSKHGACPCEQTYYCEADKVPDGYDNFYEPCNADYKHAKPITIWYE